MDSQKFENLLNLALDTPMAERDKSMELNVGFDKEDSTWELIIKYHGDLRAGLSSFLALPQGNAIKIEELIAGYAILTIPESLIEALSAVEQIEYIEKPKRLFFADPAGNTAACYAPGSRIYNDLTGKGVLVAVIDSGERVIILSSRWGRRKCKGWRTTWKKGKGVCIPPAHFIALAR